MLWFLAAGAILVLGTILINIVRTKDTVNNMNQDLQRYRNTMQQQIDTLKVQVRALQATDKEKKKRKKKEEKENETRSHPRLSNVDE